MSWIPACGAELVSVTQVLAAARKRRVLRSGSGATLLLGSRVGAVVVVVLVALLDFGLVHWKIGGQLRKLHRVPNVD